LGLGRNLRQLRRGNRRRRRERKKERQNPQIRMKISHKAFILWRFEPARGQLRETLSLLARRGLTYVHEKVLTRVGRSTMISKVRRRLSTPL
jgi:hypothetical protein